MLPLTLFLSLPLPLPPECQDVPAIPPTAEFLS